MVRSVREVDELLCMPGGQFEIEVIEIAGRPTNALASRLAPCKVPVHVWLTDDPFPRGPTGKIQKRELKAAYTQPTH